MPYKIMCKYYSGMKEELEEFIRENVDKKMLEGYSKEKAMILAREEDIKEMDDIDNNIEVIYKKWMKR